MADAQKKEDAKSEAVEGEATVSGGSKKKLFIIIGAVLGLVIVGGGAAFFMLGGKSKKADNHAEEGHGDESKGETPVGDGHGKAEGEAEGGNGKAEGDHGKADSGHGASDSGGKEAATTAHGADDKAKSGEHDKKADAHGADAKKGQDEKDSKDGHAAKDEKKADGINFGETYAFKPFHLNLGNPLENHYVRMEVAVEFMGGETQKAEIEKRLVQLRDAVVSVVSRKSKEFLLGPDGKDQLRREVLIRINRYMSKPVEAVYITDILIE